jgi:Cu/Ag efflux protein CusF
MLGYAHAIDRQRKGKDMVRRPLLIAMLFLGAGFAFQPGAGASEKQPAGSAAKPGAAASTASTQGNVLRIDKAAGTVTIKHGAIPKLNMPPMTMPYRVKDAAVLDRLKPGDRIAFEADAVGGVFTVLRLEKLK